MRRQRLHGVDLHQTSTPGASVEAGVAGGQPGFSTIERIRKAHGGDMVAIAIDETEDLGRGISLQSALGRSSGHVDQVIGAYPCGSRNRPSRTTRKLARRWRRR
jgi:hypothetical protein